MFDIKDLDRNIIVCDRDYYPILYRLKSDIGLDFQMMSPTDISKTFGFDFDSKTIPFMMNNLRLDYSSSKKLVKLLPYVDYSKCGNKLLKEAYELLKKNGLLIFDNYAKAEYERKRFFFLEMDEDIENHSLLRRLGYEVQDIHLSDLNIHTFHDEHSHSPIYLFPNRFHQYMYLFSFLRNRLSSGENTAREYKERSLVLCDVLNQKYYIDLFSKIFNIDSLYKEQESMLHRPLVANKIKKIHDKHDFGFTNDELENSDLCSLKQLIDDYGLEELDFDFAYPNLLEIIKCRSYVFANNDKGISFGKSFAFDQAKKVFVLDFEFNTFYSVSSDKNILSDSDLVKENLNPSYVKTELDRRKKSNYLKYMDIEFLSRVQQHLQDKIYDSQFMENVSADGKKQWKDEIIKIDMNKYEGQECSFTKEAINLLNCSYLDSIFYKNKLSDIRSYDHSFNFVPDLNKDRDHFSVTEIESYVRCPFKYYLSKIIPSKESDCHRMCFGVLLHKMCENILNDEYDIDKEYERGLVEYKIKYKKNTGKEDISPVEVAYLEISKPWICKFLYSLRKMKHHIKMINYDSEKGITFTITGREGEYLFKGQIDRVLYTESGENKYITIIDYKSGSESFDPKTAFLGKAVQLPLYTYAVFKKNALGIDIDKYQFGGFGIQKSFFSTISKGLKSKEDILGESTLIDNLKIRGALNSESDYIESISDTNTEETPSYFDCNLTTEYSGAKKRLDESELDLTIKFGKGKGKPEYHYSIEELYQDCIDFAEKTIKSILANEYPIRPMALDTEADSIDKNHKANCSYCIYNDICYHDNNDVRITKDLSRKLFTQRLTKQKEEEE